MRADADLMVYVAARWPTLLAEAVRLGCPAELAAEVTAEALSRCRRDWGRASHEEDVDRLVHEELAAAVARRPRVAPRGPRDEVVVLAPPTLDDLVRMERRHRTRQYRKGVAVLVVVALGAAAYVLTRDDHDDHGDRPKKEPDAVEVTRVENPLGAVVWYAAGRLHLAHSVLAVEGVVDLTAIGSGAVYGDADGGVTYAAEDGTLTRLGHKDPAVPVAATDETGLAGWFDPATSEVVVVAPETGNVRFRSEVGDHPRVLAVDGDVVYLTGAEGTRALLPTGVTSQVEVRPPDLLDVRSRIRAFQLSERLVEIQQSAFSTAFTVSGRGAQLSPDGNTVVVGNPGGLGVRLFDTRSGRRLPDLLDRADTLLAVRPGDRGTVAYAVRVAGEGAVRLRSCDLTTEECSDSVLPGLSTDVLLAR